MYAQDYDDLLPWGADPEDLNTDGWTGTALESTVASMKPLPEVLQPYTRNLAIWKCPADIGFELSGPWEDAPLNAKPTSFQKYGSSYYCRTSIILQRKPYSNLLTPCDGGSLCGTTNIALLFDGAGFWHGGSTTALYRYNALYLDGHAKSIGRAGYETLWSSPVE